MGRIFFSLCSLWFMGVGLYFVATGAGDVESGVPFVLAWICFATSSIIKAIEGNNHERH